MTSNFRTVFSTTAIVMVVSSVATNFSAAAERVAIYARDAWRRLVDERFLAPFFDVPKLPLDTLERFVERACPPIVGSEPSFVGSGLAFRRWR